MKELFSYLCSFSVVPSVVILLAVLMRPVLKKGPSYIRCILWTLVFLRLLIPVGLAELPVSAPALFAAGEEATPATPGEAGPTGDLPAGNPAAPNTPVQAPAQTPDVQAPAYDEGKPVTAPAVGQTVPKTEDAAQAEVPTPVERERDVLSLLSAVWAVGVLAMLGYMLAGNLLLRYRVKGAIVYDSRIRVIHRDCSPFVYGIFRPIIYIPASANQQDWQHIIGHESSHIKRFDHVLKPLAFLVLCVYWFNPLVWVAYILLSKDIEYACDERTVKKMESKDRKAYSLALLSVSQGENIVFAPPLSFGKVSVKERVKRVMNRKIPVWAMCLTIVICISLLALTVFTLAAGENNGADSSEPSSASTESGDGGDDSIASGNESSAGMPGGSEHSSAETEPSGGEIAGVSGIFADYASPTDREDGALFFDDTNSMRIELIKVWVNREVQNFKFITVLYDEEMNPYAGETLFEAARLTPDTPFYAQTYIPEGVCDRGIAYQDENGKTVYCGISYDSRGDENAGSTLRLGPIPSAPAASGGANADAVRYDENGNVLLSDPPTYEEILALHRQAPETYRDPGDLQPETQEMIRLENGQWYQSFVYGAYNCRCVFVSGEEVRMHALWTFLPIGSAENAFLYNIGAVYDDPSWTAQYQERAVAVRGMLSAAPDGYAYQLLLPDALIVCVETTPNEAGGTCDFPETGALAIPEAYASLFDGKTGEMVVTGVVMRDENGVFYLKDVALYR